MASHSYPRGAGRNDSEDRAVLAAAAHLTERDRHLVRLVGEHRVLTTDQLCALGFGSIITARHRLGVLAGIGVALECDLPVGADLRCPFLLVPVFRAQQRHLR